jgi:hypothetical protein
MTSGTWAEQMTLWTIATSDAVAPCATARADLATRDEGGDGARADRLTALVDDEAAVGVAVEGQPEVSAVLDHGGLQVDEVLRVERVRLVVGKVPSSSKYSGTIVSGSAGSPAPARGPLAR